MLKLLSLAWRNLWRNARRSVITMSALALGCAGIIGLHSYRENAYGIVVHDITEGSSATSRCTARATRKPRPSAPW